MAPQLILMMGLSRRLLERWTWLTMTSLPVPDSPVMSSVESTWEMVLMVSMICCISLLWTTKSAPGAFWLWMKVSSRM